MSKIVVSRLLLTGPVSIETPRVVLEEVASCCGLPITPESLTQPFSLGEILNRLSRFKGPEVTISGSKINPDIAQFVNPEVVWDNPTSLMTAFDLIQSVIRGDALDPRALRYIGRPTPDTPTHLGPSVLYKMCLDAGITTYSNTTVIQMRDALIGHALPEPDLRQMVTNIIQQATKKDLLDWLMVRSPTARTRPSENVSHSPLPNHQTLAQIHRQFQDKDYLIQRLTPQNEAEAITLGVIRYQIDLTVIPQALTNYSKLTQLGPEPFINLYPRSPVRFGVVFNPLVPPAFYRPAQITEMARLEGYNDEQMRQTAPYELLQMACVSETFHARAEHQSLKSDFSSILMEDLSDLHDQQIIVFGIRDTPLAPFTLHELTELFSNNQTFSNPLDPTFNSFSAVSLRKLRILITEKKPINKDIDRQRSKLQMVMTEVEEKDKKWGPGVSRFISLYKRSDEKVKTVINRLINKLFLLTMYMRAWNGTSEYPIRQTPPLEQVQVDINVSRAWSVFEEEVREAGVIGQDFLSLPLVEYRGGYVFSTRADEGITIADRLRISKDGDRTTNMNSCIRLTSNWLASSVHRYCMLLGIMLPFEISNLRHIS